MKFFIDTADAGEIRQAADLGLLDGVTTNPTLIKRAGLRVKRRSRPSAIWFLGRSAPRRWALTLRPSSKRGLSSPK